MPNYLITRKGDNTIRDLKDLVGRKIYVKKRSITKKTIQSVSDDIDIIELKNDKEMFRSLGLKNEADAFLSYSRDKELLDKYNLKIVKKVYDKYSEIHIGISHKYKPLRSIIDKIIKIIPRSELSKIQNKIYKKQKTVVKLTQKEKEFIKNNPEIRVHNETNWPPFNFFEFGEPKGYSIDLMNMIAKNTGLNIKYITGPTWDQFITQIKNKKLDVMLNIVKSEEREKYLNFTDPFINAMHGIAIRDDETDIKSFKDIIEKNKTIAVEKSFYYHEYINKHYPHTKLKIVNNGLETLQALSYGKVDAALGIIPVMNYIMEKNYINNLKLFGDNETGLFKPTPLRIAARKDKPELISILQKGLASITREQYRTLSSRWLGQGKTDKIKLKLAKDEIKWLQNHKTVRLLNETDWPPYDFDINGKAAGYSIEYIKELAKLAGIKIKFIKGSWSELLKKFENKEIDLVHVFNKTSQREERYIFSDPYIKPSYAITIRKDDNTIKTGKDLENKKIACGKGWSSTKIFKKYHPKSQIIEYDNISQMLKALAFGKVDAALDDLASTYYHIVKDKRINLKVAFEIDVSEKGKDQNYYLAAHKEDKQLISILNKAIKAMPPKTLEGLNKKWFGESEKILDLTKEEQSWLDKKIPVKYVYDINWAPFEWKNELGEHTGIIFDILSTIEKNSKINFEQLPTNNWDEALKLVKTGKADMYSGIGEDIKRKKYLNFTKNSIFSTPYVFVSREEDKNDYLETFKVIKNKKVAVVKGYAIESILKEKKPGLPLLTVKNVKEGFWKVRDKEIDIFIVNAATAKYFINRLGYNDLKIATKTEFNLDLKIALRKELPKEVISILDKAIESISEKELSDIYFKWTEVIVEEKINWDLIFQIAGAGLLIIVFVVYNNRRLARMVNIKTAELKNLLKSFDKNVIASKTDKRGVIVYASEAFCKISGFRADELIGNSHRILRHPDMPKELFEDLWKTIKNDRTWKGEIKNKRKDGSFYWVEVIIMPECDQDGRFCGYSAIRQDITAKKEVEELSRTLEHRVKERTSELNDERKFVNSIMNSQKNIVISSDGKCLKTANKAFLKFFGIKNIDEFIEKFGDCICDTFDESIPDEFIKKQIGEENWIDYIFNRPDQIHKARIIKNGKKHIFTITADRFGFKGEELKTAVFYDITELEAIRKNTERILSNILLPILITSQKTRKIIYANKYAELQYEKPVEELIGSDIDEVYSFKGQHKHILRSIKDQGKIEGMEEKFITAKGKEFTALLSVTPIIYNNEQAYIGMVTDITKQKMIEQEIRDIHKHTKESIEYASLIQGSLIPDNEVFRRYFKEYFTIWHPKDVVGGDIYLFDELRNEDECILMVIDCTGHGVPGAFVTMLVKAIERQIAAIIAGDINMDVSPAWCLKYFNKNMKKLLQQEDSNSISNAGFDGQILYYNKKESIVKCASARNEIFYVQNKEIHTIKGDRHSVGYKDSDAEFEFKEHIIDVSVPTNIYLSSDGYWDQLGGEKGFSFGKKRLKKLIDDIKDESMAEQQEEFIYTLQDYQGEMDRQDDITFIGLKV